uniref:Uncharacterized protein n=1 Tax=Ditylenchus dipsaci TaxID=166011 RepID=A0A915EII9_9BILA
MRLFHCFNNAFIKVLSQLFPHEKLFTSEALLENLKPGDHLWSKTTNNGLNLKIALQKAMYTDNSFDSCQRLILNAMLSVFVLVNVIAAVVLLINTQYAQYSIEKSPTRLQSCVNDFSVYKI